MHYPRSILLSEIMHLPELPISHTNRDISVNVALVVSMKSINILSLLIISNEFHDRHLMLVEDVNVLLNIRQNYLSKNTDVKISN